jgi:hypothetical protein
LKISGTGGVEVVPVGWGWLEAGGCPTAIPL